MQELFPSLVGSSTEYSFRKKVASATPIEQNIRIEKERIERDVEMALYVGGNLAVMLLAELTLYYRRELYYMAVRSSIEMRRYRPVVLDYMKLDSSDRCERLKKVLEENIRYDKNRELKVETLRFFLAVHPRYLEEFKRLLTKEEYLIVA